MEVYKSMYYTLFNRMSEAIEILKSAQCETEELFLSYEEESHDQIGDDFKKAL